MTRRLLLLATLAGLGVPVALAAGWSPWAAAFPALPCPDGWSACRVGSADLNGASLRDVAGLPLPGDARLGWFDLEPTAVLSPFVGLSEYGGVTAAAAATMAEPQSAATPEMPAVATDPVGLPPAVAVVSPPGPVSTGPTRPVGTTPTPTTAPTPTAVSGRPVGVPAPTPTAVPTTAVSLPPATTVSVPASPVSSPTAPVSPPVEAVLVPVVAAPTGCTDLVALEPMAMVGALSADTVKCLEKRIDSEAAQTTRDKASRVLIFHAEAKGDRVEWSRLVQRHLEDIDRSDPDLCFKYALELSRNGRSLGVIRWAEVALENKHRWQGATYKKRVYDLHRLKAQAANSLWTAAAKEYATGEHTEENAAKAEKYRAMTRDYALEWLDYARASQQDGATALALCVSAAGNRTFCEGG